MSPMLSVQVPATIALIGVVVNAVVSQRQHRDKERAALRDRKRKEASDVLVEALGAATAYWDLVEDLGADFSGIGDRIPTRADLGQAVRAVLAAELKLELLDLDPKQSLKTLRQAVQHNQTALESGNDQRTDHEATQAARTEMIKQFRATLTRIDAEAKASDH
ncbi:hypothetical protein [Nocardia sp. NPDC056000]|uniref:hypothetical protein n=1 Tax=Nocardia sp. NPDC056000 TaxID=3345674 RepID=UPI0035DC844B